MSQLFVQGPITAENGEENHARELAQPRDSVMPFHAMGSLSAGRYMK